jgi:hypothetical protein
MPAAAKLDTLIPSGAPASPEGSPERIAAAVAREAFAQLGRVGGSRGQWLAIGALTAAFVWHVMGDGTVREESRKTKVLVEWLVRRDLAREHNEPLPALPYDLL